MRHIADRLQHGGAADPLSPGSTPGVSQDALWQAQRSERPVGYVTTEYLATLWDERSRQVDVQKAASPDDLVQLEHCRRLASQAMRAYRLLSELERQLGFELALPILGPWRGSAGSPADPVTPDGVAETID